MRDQILLTRAKAMRREPTAAERRMWQALRAKRLDGAGFRQQVPIGHYIADFACRSPHMLIVELDGETHDHRVAYDEARTSFLEARGYRVLRFANADVLTNLEGVLTVIRSALLSPLPDPLP